MGEPAREPYESLSPERSPLRVVRGGDVVRECESEVLSLSPPPPPPHHHRASGAKRASRARVLRASERALALWLRRELGTVGAEAMVRRYGVRAIVRAVTENQIVLSNDRYRGRLEVNDALRSPGGFLRMVLREELGW